MVAKRVEVLLEDPAFLARQEQEMRFLLEGSSRADEIPQLARAYAEQALLRKWMRFHPRAITRQRFEGLEWLTTRRDTSRPAILSFTHHHRYDGMWGSLKAAGVEVHALALADILVKDRSLPIEVRQHTNVISRGGPLVSTAVGSAGLKELLQPGVILGIASDVASRTPVEFLGKKVLGSSGAPRLATDTNSPVIIVTVVRDGEDSHHLRIHEPLEPADFASPEALLDEMLRIHGEAILAWPEAYDTPLTRFGALDD